MYRGNYNNPPGSSDIPVIVPNGLRYASRPSPIALEIKSGFVQSNSSSTLGPGQTVTLYMPTSGHLDCNQLYFSFKAAVTCATAGDTPKIPLNGYDFIRRLSIFIGSVEATLITDANELMAMLNKAVTSEDYIKHDGGILEGFNRPLVNGGVREYIVSLAGILQAEKLLPLDLFGSSNMTINIEFCSASHLSFKRDTGALDGDTDLTATSALSYVITDPRIYYTTVIPSMEYTTSLIQQVSQAGVMRIPFIHYNGSRFSTGAGGTYNVLIGDNAKSLMGIVMGRHQTTVTTTNPGDTPSPIGGLQDFSINGFQRFSVRIDGMLHKYEVDTPTRAFAELSLLFSNLFSAANTGHITYQDYFGEGGRESRSFIMGISAKKLLDDTLSNIGLPVQSSVQIEIQGNTEASTLFVYLIKDVDLLVDANGVVDLKR